MDTAGPTSTTGAHHAGQSIIEAVSARRERKRSASITGREEHFFSRVAPSPPTTAASLVNFTPSGRGRITMASFLRDGGVGQPMSSNSSGGDKTGSVVASGRSDRPMRSSQARTRGGPSPAASVSTTVVPQVRIVNGEIVVDEEAALHQASPSTGPMYPMDVVNESGKHLTSHSFVKSIGNNRWGQDETDQFYEALSMCGTDFALISLLFPRRSREQVKGKFKVEERNNPGKVALYLKNRRPLDTAWFERARQQREEEDGDKAGGKAGEDGEAKGEEGDKENDAEVEEGMQRDYGHGRAKADSDRINEPATRRHRR